MNIPSKQAIVEVAIMSGDRDILYSYVANENDHTVGALGATEACIRSYSFMIEPTF